ncbi:Por secretion system C-terminal sorting domain-containing protein [Chitinophaga sp. CF118]|uniref:T9SS type A sorting domain-containing protein n=1 Tax=Chitinophaga sp. CF118 TaxID=1884367 RepID=UPI0008E8655F|nr:T9SS type A sorting domain-containing protein [Chitinophaga sp. CF118]SFD06787.1 Por secretion system C-terminal sorting domain-containing protein [Chitinophaga sp. CF118]
MKRNLLLLCFLIFFTNTFAQQAAYIPAAGKVWSYGNVAFFGDVTNDGLLGSSPSSILYFMGKQWTNGFGALLNDESATGTDGTGGTFRFASTNGQQIVAGGYNVASKTGASFPNFEVANPNGILLADLNDLKIRNTLNFNNGHIFLNGWNLMVGHNNSGTLTGYNDQRFVVTGTGSSGGFMYRAKVTTTAGPLVFPIGTTATNYAPAGVVYDGAADDFKARVFDSVYQLAVSGNTINDSVVYKTWNMGQVNAGAGAVALTLQHMDSEEGIDYVPNRDKSYISRFVNGAWEVRNGVNDNMGPGTLNAQPMISAATMHARGFTSGLGMNSYYTKFTTVTSYLPADIIHFNAYRVTYSLVDLVWTTIRETNNAVFEIERMYDNETAFTKIATVATKAPGGNSTSRLDYFYEDSNSYDGWTYYRIKVVSSTGRYLYTDVREVPPLIKVTVYPNPNFGDFKVDIKGIKVTLVMQVFDTWGQPIRTQDIVKNGQVHITDMPKGTYFLVLTYKETKKQAYVCKVIVIDH